MLIALGATQVGLEEAQEADSVLPARERCDVDVMRLHIDDELLVAQVIVSRTKILTVHVAEHAASMGTRGQALCVRIGESRDGRH